MKKTIIIIFSSLFLNYHLIKAQSWPKQFNAAGVGCTSKDLKEDYDHGFILAGQVEPWGTTPYQAILMKLDINANLLWSKIIGNRSDLSSVFDMQKTIDNGLIICGITSKYSIPNNYVDAFLMKLNSCGEKEWCTVISGPQDNNALSIIQDSLGNYISLIQYYTGYDDSTRITLVKFDTGGKPIWVQHQAQYNLPGFSNEEGEDLIQTAAGDYLITGGCQDPSQKPLWILTDTLGAEIWNFRWGGLFGYAWQSVEDKYGNFFLNHRWNTLVWKYNSLLEEDSINSYPYQYDSLCPHMITSDTLEMDCFLYTGINDLPTRAEYENTLDVWPNPSDGYLTIKLHQSPHKNDELNICNIDGQNIFSMMLQNNQDEVIFNLSALHSGIYIVRHTRNQMVLGTKRFIKKD